MHRYGKLLTSAPVVSGHRERPIVAPDVAAGKDGNGRDVAGGDVTAEGEATSWLVFFLVGFGDGKR